jgi:hypothetical protein
LLSLTVGIFVCGEGKEGRKEGRKVNEQRGTKKTIQVWKAAFIYESYIVRMLKV